MSNLSESYLKFLSFDRIERKIIVVGVDALLAGVLDERGFVVLISKESC